MQLNKEQERAVGHTDGPMLVLAGPGSGKTHVLTNRIKALIEEAKVPPDNILVITFSKKAAQSMQYRFNMMSNAFYPVNFGTFHAVFFHILTYHGLYSKEGILDSKTKLIYVKRAGRFLNIKKASDLSWQKDMLDKISYYKNIGEMLFKEGAPDIMDKEEEEEFRKVFEKYMLLCRKNNVLDFDDMVCECRRFLESNEAALKFWQQKFKYILIDEFQDINAAQYEVVKLLLDGKSSNIFAVGDDDQSIYGFRGAAPGIMRTFLDDFKGCEVVNLKLNYRCAYEVVRLADASINHNKDRMSRPMQQTLKNRKRGCTYIKTFETAKEEAEYIIEELKKYNTGDVAILYRSNHSVSALEDEFKIKGIAYTKSAPKISFYELDAAKLIISYMKIACGKGEKEDFLRCLNAPQRGIDREALNNAASCHDGFRIMKDYYMHQGDDNERLFLQEDEEALKKIDKWERDCLLIKSLPAPAALNYLLLGVGVRKHIENNYKRDFRYPLNEDEFFAELKERFAGFDAIETIIDAVYEIENCGMDNKKSADEKTHLQVNRSYDENGASPVTLMSAHASKGLEFPVVFVAGLQDGLFPHHKYLNSMAGIEEERRLLYVAMTRAEDVLYLCGHGSEHGKRVSRFIAELTEDNNLKDNAAKRISVNPS